MRILLAEKLSGEMYVMDGLEWCVGLVNHEEPYRLRTTARFFVNLERC